jgi:hypothetical protein
VCGQTNQLLSDYSIIQSLELALKQTQRLKIFQEENNVSGNLFEKLSLSNEVPPTAGLGA